MLFRSEDAPDSRLEVSLEPVEAGTRLVLFHSGLPDGTAAEYEQGWRDYYFDPMASYFARQVQRQAESPSVVEGMVQEQLSLLDGMEIEFPKVARKNAPRSAGKSRSEKKKASKKKASPSARREAPKRPKSPKAKKDKAVGKRLAGSKLARAKSKPKASKKRPAPKRKLASKSKASKRSARSRR